MKPRAYIYARNSTDGISVEEQVYHLRMVVNMNGWDAVGVISDPDVCGVKKRDRRVGFNRLQKHIEKNECDLVLVWDGDRIAKNLNLFSAFLNKAKSNDVDLYIHKVGLNTTTPEGQSFYNYFPNIADNIQRSSVKAGLVRAKSSGKRLGRPPIPRASINKAKQALREGLGIRTTARLARISPTSVLRIKQTMGATS